MLYVCVSYFVVRGCAVSRRYINVCNCDMFSVVNVYLDNLKFCVVCINGQWYVCCSECNIVSKECKEPTPCLVHPISMHSGEVMYFGCVCFRGELGFLNFDDICMCAVNKYFELFEFVFDSVYVDLQYDDISLTFTAGSVSLCCVFGLSVTCILLFVLHVCMLRECEGDGNAGVGDGGCVVAVSAGHVGGTRGSGIVSSVAHMLWMSVVRGMRVVGRVCKMCMCLAWGCVGGKWMRGLGLDVCLCCGGVVGE